MTKFELLPCSIILITRFFGMAIWKRQNFVSVVAGKRLLLEPTVVLLRPMRVAMSNWRRGAGVHHSLCFFNYLAHLQGLAPWCIVFGFLETRASNYSPRPDSLYTLSCFLRDIEYCYALQSQIRCGRGVFGYICKAKWSQEYLNYYFSAIGPWCYKC